MPVPFGVALRVDFWRVRHLKIVFPLQREHDFEKIAILEKTPKIDENRIRRRFRTHFFGPGCDFWRFWGPRWEANFMKNAFEKATAKSDEKKSIGRTNTIWVGVMRWASGEVRRGHTSYDSLRTGSRSESRSCKAFSTPRRPSAKGGGLWMMVPGGRTPPCLGLRPRAPLQRFAFDVSEEEKF